MVYLLGVGCRLLLLVVNGMFLLVGRCECVVVLVCVAFVVVVLM